MERQTSILPLLLLLAAGPAYAHGEQVLLVPVGHLAAFAVILLAGALLKVRRAGRLLALVVALGTAVPLWYVPGSVFPEALRYTGWGNFILGFSPVAAVGLLVLLAYRKAFSGAAA